MTSKRQSRTTELHATGAYIQFRPEYGDRFHPIYDDKGDLAIVRLANSIGRDGPSANHPKRSGNFQAAASVVSLASAAKQLQQHHEHVDEVEVEIESAHDCCLRCRRHVTHHLMVAILDPLRVVGGEAGEHQHADH